MDRITAMFVDGIGAAAATSGILTQLQGRIFGLLYLHPGPMSLDEVTDELQQSKSNVSVNIRGLVDWQLVRQLRVPGSRKDHYEAATDFWRVMQEIMERRFRWNLRQVVATAAETERAVAAAKPAMDRDDAERAAYIAHRVTALGQFFAAVDSGVGAFSRGEALAAEPLQAVFAKIPIEGA